MCSRCTVFCWIVCCLLDACVQICQMPDCVMTSGEMMAKMDLNVDPCNDFYEYSCSAYISNINIPPDKAIYTTLGGEMDGRKKARVRKVNQHLTVPNMINCMKIWCNIRKATFQTLLSYWDSLTLWCFSVIKCRDKAFYLMWLWIAIEMFQVFIICASQHWIFSARIFFSSVEINIAATVYTEQRRAHLIIACRFWKQVDPNIGVKIQQRSRKPDSATLPAWTWQLQRNREMSRLQR